MQCCSFQANLGDPAKDSLSGTLTVCASEKSPVLIGKFFELSQPWLPHPRFTQAPKLLPGLSQATCQTSWTKKRFQKVRLPEQHHDALLELLTTHGSWWQMMWAETQLLVDSHWRIWGWKKTENCVFEGCHQQVVDCYQITSLFCCFIPRF